MTKEELQKITQSMQVLDHFASTTNLERGWHARWQQVFEGVQRQIAALVEKPKPGKPSKVKPPKPGDPSNN